MADPMTESAIAISRNRPLLAIGERWRKKDEPSGTLKSSLKRHGWPDDPFPLAVLLHSLVTK
jgi:hypothetical protein